MQKDEKTIASLKSYSKFIPIYQDKKIFYGGHQRWLKNNFLMKRGCGVIAAANILVYMSMNIERCKNLYDKEDLSKESFQEFLYELLIFIKPQIIGIPSVYNLARGVKSYAWSKGIILKSNYKPLKLNTSEYIIGGLNENSPIAMLQYYKRTDYNFHWQTIVRYYSDKDNNFYIETSNWSRKYTYKFENIKNNKFVYFTVK